MTQPTERAENQIHHAKEQRMITRRQAEDQARLCLEYHAAICAGIVGAVALLKPSAFGPVVTGLGAGLALHTACLYAIPSTRESLLRKTASLMEDRRHVAESHSENQRYEVTAGAI